MAKEILAPLVAYKVKDFGSFVNQQTQPCDHEYSTFHFQSAFKDGLENNSYYLKFDACAKCMFRRT